MENPKVEASYGPQTTIVLSMNRSEQIGQIVQLLTKADEAVLQHIHQTLLRI